MLRVRMSSELVEQALREGETFDAATVKVGLPPGARLCWAKPEDVPNETMDLVLYFSTEEDREEWSGAALIGRAYADIGVVDLVPSYQKVQR